jgi:exportin-7
MHRKICISFRDTSLLDIFQLSLTTLRQLFSKPGGTEEEKLKELALSLSLRCLSFDFIGTTPDESASDVYTVQAPSSWRTVLYEPATLRLFVDSYCASRPPVSTNAMGCLVQMASVRRTLFLSEDERHTYLANLMQMTIDVLKNKTALLCPRHSRIGAS